MHISLEWLTEFVDLPPTPELCQGLTNAGVEVEAVVDPAARVQGVIVAEVRDVRPHPNAERLHVCDVFDGQSIHLVVCGAPNVVRGMRVAFAPVGSHIPDLKSATQTLTMAPATIRGVVSHGMLCAKSELGFQVPKEGLWALPESWPLGQEISKYAGFATVLDLSITPNRSDLLCHLGIAREVAAANQKRTQPFKWRLTEKGPDVGSVGRVVVEDMVGCKRYVGRVVRNLKVTESPTWLKNRLESIGQRSVNNVVDATNYVMHELGQPLHAFDLSRLAVESGCPTLRVRRAREGEILRTLDGIERSLDPDDLIVADPNRPVALAGIMGGADTEVRASTNSILLESACFDGASVRHAAKRHGLRTDASQHFERGVDVGIMVKAIDRCAQILTEIAEGEVAKGILEIAQKIDPQREVPVRLKRIQQILGVSLAAEAVVQLLEPLEIRCVTRTDAALFFEIPSFRTDLTREIDLIEEIARRYGYDRIPDRLPDASSTYQYQGQTKTLVPVVRQAMLACGLDEVVSLGFGSPTAFEPYVPLHGTPLKLLNPLGEELSALRTTLIPGLLQIAQHNMRQGDKDGRFFEIGTTFSQPQQASDKAQPPQTSDDELAQPQQQALSAAAVTLPQEEKRLACLLVGAREPGHWYAHNQRVDATDIAGIADTLAQACGLELAWHRVNAAIVGLNPFCGARLEIGTQVVGFLGQLDLDIAQRFGFHEPVFVLELCLDALEASPSHLLQVRKLPRFPKMRRDLAIICAEDSRVSAAQLQLFIQNHAGGELGPRVVENVWLFDRYKGKPLADNEVSMAFAIDYRHQDRTLEEAEVATAFDALQRQLLQSFKVQIRSS